MSTLTATNDANAGAQFQSNVQATGLNISHLTELAQVQLAVAELYVNAPPGSIAAGDIASGTFGANIPDTGTYTFPGTMYAATGIFSVTNPAVFFDTGVSATAEVILTRQNGGTPVLLLARINGTFASPTVVVDTSGLGNFSCGGYDGTTLLANGVLYTGEGTETWSSTAHGCRAHIDVRANGTTTAKRALTIDQDSSLILFGNGSGPGSGAGNVGAVTKSTRPITAFTDATPKTILTATIPNATHRATIRVTVDGALGAGGAVGAGEAYGTISYDFIVGRFAGAATTMVASTAYGSAVSLSAGAATIAIVAAIGSVSGANNTTQTYTITATITKGSGASDNHVASVMCEVLNANATGITVA